MLSSAGQSSDNKKTSLINILVSRIADIESAVNNGETYKEIAEGINIEYNYFMTYFYRAKKKTAKIELKKIVLMLLRISMIFKMKTRARTIIIFRKTKAPQWLVISQIHQEGQCMI